jgi:hypothetical protein
MMEDIKLKLELHDVQDCDHQMCGVINTCKFEKLYYDRSVMGLWINQRIPKSIDMKYLKFLQYATPDELANDNEQLNNIIDMLGIFAYISSAELDQQKRESIHIFYNRAVYEVIASRVLCTKRDSRFPNVFHRRLKAFIKILSTPKRIPPSTTIFINTLKDPITDLTIPLMEYAFMEVPTMVQIGKWIKTPVNRSNLDTEINRVYSYHLTIEDLIIEFSLNTKTQSPISKARRSSIWEPRLLNLILQFLEIPKDDISDLTPWQRGLLNELEHTIADKNKEETNVQLQKFLGPIFVEALRIMDPVERKLRMRVLRHIAERLPK